MITIDLISTGTKYIISIFYFDLDFDSDPEFDYPNYGMANLSGLLWRNDPACQRRRQWPTIIFPRDIG